MKSSKLLKILFAFFTALIFTAVVFPMTASAAETATSTSMTDDVKAKVYDFTKKMLLAEAKLEESLEKAEVSIWKAYEKLEEQIIKHEEKLWNGEYKLLSAKWKESNRKWEAKAKMYTIEPSKRAEAITKEIAKAKSVATKLVENKKKFYEKARESTKKLGDKLKTSADKLKTKATSTATKLKEKQKKFYANWDTKLQKLGGGKYDDFDWTLFYDANPEYNLEVNPIVINYEVVSDEVDESYEPTDFEWTWENVNIMEEWDKIMYGD